MDTFHRRSIRLQGYDYSQPGYYFVTVCTYKKQKILGDVINGIMIKNKYGILIENVLKSLPNHHSIKLDTFQIMPNHLHCILIINGRGCARTTPTLLSNTPQQQNNTFQHIVSGSLPCVIRSFKSECTKQIKKGIIWQRNYYEHIIRNEHEYISIQKYIRYNPLYWESDEENI